MSDLSACILGCAGLDLSQDERRFFADAQPWGFILFARNIATPDQTRGLVASLRESVGRAAPVLIDQEGGRVQRMTPPHWRQWLPPLDQARFGPRAMYLRARIIAAELQDLGIDVNCAPMADIADPDTHPVLRNRCYGADVATVVANARAVADGLLAGGVMPVLKHLPGHGRARVDSHLDLPVVDASADQIAAWEFAPFAALKDLPLGMSAHMLFPSLDPDRPATQSPILIDAIRNQIGFQGLLMTDDISMQALDGTIRERATASLAAGCDLVLHCNGDLAEMQEIAAAVGHLTGPSLDRATRAQAKWPQAQPVDLAAIEAELADLLQDPGDGPG